MTTEKLSIIAIDDDRAFLRILGAMVRRIDQWEISLDTYTDWSQAKLEVRKGQHDLILLDYVLKNTTGLEILNELRASGDVRPVIILTGHEEREVVVKTTKAGAHDYIVKAGLIPDTLRRVFHSALTQYALEQEKALLTQELNHSQKMETIGTLASGIAHDFNNILTGIMNNTEIIKEHAMASEIAPELTSIETACDQMAEIVRQLLNFSRPAARKRTVVSVSKAISDALLILKHTLPKGVSIDLHETPEDLRFTGTENMLNQALFALCLNASDAMAGQGVIRIRTDLESASPALCAQFPDLGEGPFVKVTISDSGKGIPSHLQQRIFEPFFTTKTFGTDKGTGLGLAVTWQNIRSHGGVIDLQSTLGEGSQFTIYLPSTSPQTYLRGAQTARSRQPQKRHHIILVDDEELVLKATGKFLSRAGFMVSTATSGERCLELYKTSGTPVDAVVLDISMPHMDGRECLVRLLEIDPQAKVIFSSGHDMISQEQALLAAGAKAVIQKPYKILSMKKLLAGILDEPPSTARR